MTNWTLRQQINEAREIRLFDDRPRYVSKRYAQRIRQGVEQCRGPWRGIRIEWADRANGRLDVHVYNP